MLSTFKTRGCGGIQDQFCLYWKLPDIFGQWRNSGSILFVLQNSKHFQMVEEHRIHLFVLQKFPTFLDGGGISGSILFLMQNSWHFRTVEEFRIYFICTAKIPDVFGRGRNYRIYFICTTKFLTFLDSGGFQDLFICTAKFLTFLDSGGIS